jgi:hypothetical protein
MIVMVGIILLVVNDMDGFDCIFLRDGNTEVCFSDCANCDYYEDCTFCSNYDVCDFNSNDTMCRDFNFG